MFNAHSSMSRRKITQNTLPGVFITSAYQMLTNTGCIVFVKLVAWIAGTDIASNSVGTVLIASTDV